MRIAQFHSSFKYKGGIMLEIFIAGCKHACKDCFNLELWLFDAGEEMPIMEIIKKIKHKAHLIDGIVLTGGDPLFNPHTYLLIKMIKLKFPKFKIWLYTGFTKEEIDINEQLKQVFVLCDVVVTDRYDKTRPITKLTGSDNQRIWRN